MKLNLNTVGRLALIGVALLAAGLFVGAVNQFMPAEASAEAATTDKLFNVMLVIATIIFLIVEGGLLYSIFKFGKPKDDDTDGPPIHGNTTLEIVWTAIPAIIVLGLSIYSYQVFADQQTPKNNELAIHVLGQQFVWSFDYPHDASVNMRSSDELHVPVGQPIRMEINAKDVMHGFWIPEFRVKQDAIPGRTTEVRFTPTVIGEYQVVCYELCGNGHGIMRNRVVVQSQADYDTYVNSLIIKPPAHPPAGQHNADWGKYLVVSNKYGCAGCHYLPDAQINGHVGPPWVNIADAAAKQVPGQDARTRLTHAILYPNEYVVPGYPANVMPQNFGQLMDDTDLNSIVDYLLLQTASPSAASPASGNGTTGGSTTNVVNQPASSPRSGSPANSPAQSAPSP